nr:immunoglobulin-like domain-containing protein [Terribacillus saccharophilus]
MKQIILLLLLIFLSGCGGIELEPSKYTDEITTAEDILLEIEDDSLNSEEGFIFRILNNSDTFITIGREYVLEKYDKKREEWLQIPLKDNIGSQADGMIIDSGSETSFFASFDTFNYNFPKGDYRIIKVLSSEGDGILLYDDFKIDK